VTAMDSIVEYGGGDGGELGGGGGTCLTIVCCSLVQCVHDPTIMHAAHFVHDDTLHTACSWGEFHVHMFAHSKSGIAYQDRNRRPDTVADYKGTPPAAEAAAKVYQSSICYRRGLPATSSASVVTPDRKQDGDHRGRQLLDSGLCH
jgi:hypothetical protein